MIETACWISSLHELRLASVSIAFHTRGTYYFNHTSLHHTAAHWYDLDYEPSCMYIAPATNVEFVLDS